MKVGPRIVEGALWAVAGVSAFWAALWVFGVNGLQLVGLGDLPDWLTPVTLYGAQAQWTAKPAVPVRLDETDFGSLFHFFVQLNGAPDQNGAVPPHWGELLPGASVVQLWDASLLQRISYLLLEVTVFVAVSVVALTLARLVADSRKESPFTLRNVRRLQRIGALLLVGAPVASFAHWACERWMVESSSVGDRVTRYGYGLSSLPVWTMLVGAAVLVLADVWKRGVAMADDVRGLV